MSTLLEGVILTIGIVVGITTMSLMNGSYIEDLEKENRALKAASSPLEYVCPEGQVKLATKSDDGPWVTRCVGPRGSK